jgi:DNA invertase Pin-like site-specific DNA recombinase
VRDAHLEAAHDHPLSATCSRLARVSITEQTTENQLLELRRYVAARGWTAREYVDQGVSGTKDRRPTIDQLTAEVRRHKVDAVVCWPPDCLR